MFNSETWYTVDGQAGRRGGYARGRGRGGGGRGGVVRGGGGRGGAVCTNERRQADSYYQEAWGHGKFNMPAISLFDSKDPQLEAISDMIDVEPTVKDVTRAKEDGTPDDLVKAVSALEMKIDGLAANCLTLRGQVQLLAGDLQTKVDEHSDTLDELKPQIDYLSCRDNIVEQRDRDKAVRIFNYDVPKNITATELSNKLYDDLFKDMFVQAAKDGLLPSRQVVHLDERDENGEPIIRTKNVVDLPLPSETVEYTHTLPGARPANLPPGAQQRRAARIPVVIVKLKSRIIKEIFHKYKKDSLDKFNSAKNLNYAKKVFIVDDLTKVNLNCLNDLKASPKIEEAFVLGGKIRFSYKSNPEKKLTVQNPFASELSEICNFPKRF
jgi:hypothetical protein